MLNSDRLRKIILYFISKGTADGLLALRGVVLAGFLGPEVFGGWVLFRLCTNYFGFAHLGILNGLEFHAARRSAVRDFSPAESKYWQTALGFVLIVFGTIASLSLFISFWVERPQLALSMRWFSGAILTEQVWILGLSYVRATGNLKKYATYEVTNATLQFLFALCLAPIYGLAGAFAGFFSATALSLFFLYSLLSRIPSISKTRLKEMLKVGFPVLVSLLIGFNMASVDRLIVAGTGNLTLLGLYGFAFSVAGISGSLAWVIRVVIYPDVYASVAAKGAGPALEVHLQSTLLPFARIMPLLLGFGALLIDPLISFLLPKYVDAIPATRILVFAGVTAGLERLGALGVIAAEKQKFLPVFSCASLVLNIILSLSALWGGYGLQGVACAALISRMAFGLATLMLLVRVAQTFHPKRFTIKVTFPMLWCILSVVLIAHNVPMTSPTRTFLAVAIFAFSLIPVLPGAFADLRKILKPTVFTGRQMGTH